MARIPFTMRKFWILALICLAAVRVSGQAAQSPLRVLAAEDNMWIGAAINTTAFRNDTPYLELAAQQYNIITPESMFKFGPLSPAPYVYNWTDADALVNWAEANNIRIHGHNLVWHYELPLWLNERRFTPAELEALLEDRIKQTVGRYKGRVQEWDVVNEAVADNGSGFKDTTWHRAIGDDYVAKAFEWAHEADPDALLFYNDYSVETQPPKADGVFNLVKSLLDEGVPINGVGLQMHVEVEQGPRIMSDHLEQVMARFAALGLKVEVTELDVSLGDHGGTRAEELTPQAEVYRNVVQACVDAPNCDTVITWGMDDGHSWIPAFRGHPDWPLIFDAALNPKPAYFAVAETLANASRSG